MALTIASTLRRAADALHQQDGIVWLIDLARTATVTARFALWTESVVYAGNTYTPIVGEIQDWSQEAGALIELRLILSNVDRTIQGYLESGEVRNRRTTLRVVPTTAIAPFGSGASGQDLAIPLYVQEVICNEKGAVLTLSLWQLQTVEIPRAQFTRSRCMWVFKDLRTCGYTGAATTCDKTYNSSAGCLGRANEARYGGFPNLLSGPTVAIP